MDGDQNQPTEGEVVETPVEAETAAPEAAPEA